MELDGQDGQKFTHAMGKPREFFFSQIKEQNPSNVPKPDSESLQPCSLKILCSPFPLAHIGSKRRLGCSFCKPPVCSISSKPLGFRFSPRAGEMSIFMHHTLIVHLSINTAFTGFQVLCRGYQLWIEKRNLQKIPDLNEFSLDGRNWLVNNYNGMC